MHLSLLYLARSSRAFVATIKTSPPPATQSSTSAGVVTGYEAPEGRFREPPRYAAWFSRCFSYTRTPTRKRILTMSCSAVSQSQSVLCTGTRFSNLYTAVDTPASSEMMRSRCVLGGLLEPLCGVIVDLMWITGVPRALTFGACVQVFVDG